jgi:hypothetical protein
MQVRNATTKRKALQAAGKPAVKKQGRAHTDGDRKTSVSAAPLARIGLHVLERQLESKSILQLALSSGLTHLSPTKGLLDIVDTKENQLQAIADLYEIMIAQPKYKKLAGKQWNANVEPITVLQWILRKLGALADGEDWTVDTYQEDGHARYCFVVTKPYSALYSSFGAPPFRGGMRFLDLEFLPHLVKRDLPMHDLIIDIVALVSKVNKVPLWDEDGEYSGAMEIAQKDSYYRSEWIMHRVAPYLPGGIADKYLKLIKARRRTVSVADIYEKLRTYQATSQRKEGFVWWIKRGLEVVDKKQNIRACTYIPGYENRPHMTPWQMYKFIWRKWDRDPVHEIAQAALEDLRKHKSYKPINFSITKPGKIMKPVEIDSYPAYLDQFMGLHHFSRGYINYYYGPVEKERLGEKPSTLLEILTDNITDNQIQIQV